MREPQRVTGLVRGQLAQTSQCHRHRVRRRIEIRKILRAWRRAEFADRFAIVRAIVPAVVGEQRYQSAPDQEVLPITKRPQRDIALYAFSGAGVSNSATIRPSASRS